MSPQAPVRADVRDVRVLGPRSAALEGHAGGSAGRAREVAWALRQAGRPHGVRVQLPAVERAVVSGL
jgi:hypothetical protein